MTLILRSLFVLAAVYLIALLALYILQRSVLYIPPSIYLTPAAVNLEDAIEVPSPDNDFDKIGWWMPPKHDDAPTVIYFHGNGSAVYNASDVYSALQAQGYGVFSVAYPGYPGRTGPTTQQSLTDAAITAYDYVSAQGVAPEKIAFYGTSLGAGVAAQLTLHRKPALIIMEAPFTSAADMAQLSFPMFPARRLTKDKFLSDRALAGANIPMVWIHGTRDNVIPLFIGQALFDGYDGPKSAHVIDKGQHNNLWYLGGDAIVLDALSELNDAALATD